MPWPGRPPLSQFCFGRGSLTIPRGSGRLLTGIGGMVSRSGVYGEVYLPKSV